MMPLYIHGKGGINYDDYTGRGHDNDWYSMPALEEHRKLSYRVEYKRYKSWPMYASSKCTV